MKNQIKNINDTYAKIRSHLKEIQCYSHFENTRMLYNFMQELSDRIPEIRKNSDYKWEYTGYNGEGGLKKRAGLYEDLHKKSQPGDEEPLLVKVNEILDKCLDEQGKYLKQNPLSAFLEFYGIFFGQDDLYLNISYCLQYFNTLRYLADDHPVPTRSNNDDLPYLYEDVCLSMREMTGCYAAYILYGKDGETAQLVSRSGYVVPKIEDEAEPPRFMHELWDRLVSEILRLKKDSKKKNEEVAPEEEDEKGEHIKDSQEIIEDVYKLRYIDTANGESEVNDYMAIVLPLDEKQNSEKIYIFLDCFVTGREITAESQFDITEKDLNAICKILFMRNRLLSCLKRDYAVLLNFRYDCGYIKSVDEKTDSPKILHISDLHLEEKNRGILMDGIRCLPGFPKNDNQIDLLAITGDIVNFSSNAAAAQDKYRMAKEFVRELAKRLWGYYSKDGKVCILPHDWKRRVLIVPGNHDYTTMSDVVVETASRKIKAAFPANESAGTMSKLTYYIEFLADCLDVPIVEFVRNDMNEVRDYKKLKLKIGLFNTVAQSNSLQNNKVGFTQKEKLADLLKRKEWLPGKDNRSYIVLSHHSPSYKINYFDDRYKFYNFDKYEIEPPDCDKIILGTVLRDVWQAISEEIVKQNSIISFGEFCEDLQVLSYAKGCDKQKGVIHYLAKELPDSVRDKEHDKFFKSELRDDLQKLDRIRQKWKEWNANQNKEQGEPFSEFDLAYMAQWWSLAKEQTEDQKSFDDVWENLIKKKQLRMCLVGHEHKICVKDNYYVEDQMYNGNHGDYNWSVHRFPYKDTASSEHYEVYLEGYINDLWIEYLKKADKLCEMSTFFAAKRKSPDAVSNFFCKFVKKVKDKGFLTICAKWRTDRDPAGLYVNFLNKAEFDAVFSAGSINGYTIYEDDNGFSIDLN